LILSSFSKNEKYSNSHFSFILFLISPLLSSLPIARTRRTYSEQLDTLSAATATPAVPISATTATAEAESRQAIRAAAATTTRTEHIAEK
jgi:hypothetical protein